MRFPRRMPAVTLASVMDSSRCQTSASSSLHIRCAPQYPERLHASGSRVHCASENSGSHARMICAIVISSGVNASESRFLL